MKITFNEIHPMTPVQRLDLLKEQTKDLMNLVGIVIDATDEIEPLAEIYADLERVRKKINEQLISEMQELAAQSLNNMSQEDILAIEGPNSPRLKRNQG